MTPRIIIGATLVVTASVLAGCSLLRDQPLLDVSGQGGYAGWSAIPLAPEDRFIGASERLCGQHSEFASPEGADVVLIDQRGPDGAMFLWSHDANTAYCLIVNDGSGLVEMGWGDNFDALDDHEVTGFRMKGGYIDAPRQIVGRVPASTSDVAILLEDGTALSATTGQGWFVAWWPTGSQVHEIVARDAAGRVLARSGAYPAYPELPLETPASPPVPN